MRSGIKIATAAVSVVALAAVGVGAAGGTGDDSEAPITGPALDKASDAALEHLGGGRVTDTEVGDEESRYEVEVTRADGSQVDVQLDRDFNVVGDEADSDEDEDEDDEEVSP